MAGDDSHANNIADLRVDVVWFVDAVLVVVVVDVAVFVRRRL